MPGLGFITSITFIFLVGIFMSSWLGASVLNLGEWFIKRMPLVRHIYHASKQISAAISPGTKFSTSGFKRLWSYSSIFIWCLFFSVFRSEHASLQGSGHHKAPQNWWIRPWIHYFECPSSGMIVLMWLTLFPIINGRAPNYWAAP